MIGDQGSTFERIGGACFFGTASGLKMVGAGCLDSFDPNFLAQVDFRVPGALSKLPISINESLYFLLPVPSTLGRVLLIGQARYARDDVGRDGFIGCAVATLRDDVSVSGYDKALNLVGQLLEYYSQTDSYLKDQRVDFDILSSIIPSAFANFSIENFGWSEQSKLSELGLPERWYRKVTPSIIMSLMDRFKGEFRQVVGDGYILREVVNRECELQLGDDLIEHWFDELVGRPQIALSEALSENRELRNALLSVREELSRARSEVQKLESDRANTNSLLGRLERIIATGSPDAVLKKEDRILELVEQNKQLRLALEQCIVQRDRELWRKEQLSDAIKNITGLIEII